MSLYGDMSGMANQQNMALGQQAMMNANAVTSQPTLGGHLERFSKRLIGLIEAIEQMRTKLEPVLVSQPPSQNKEGPRDASGSPAMQTLEELMARVDYAHQMINEIMRRAAL